MRHEATDWARGEQIARNAPENPFAQAAVAIGSSDEQISGLIQRELDQLCSAGSLTMQHDFDSPFDPMVSKIVCHGIKVLLGCGLFACLTYLCYGDARRFVQERKRVLHRTARLAGIFPADDDVVCA